MKGYWRCVLQGKNDSVREWEGKGRNRMCMSGNEREKGSEWNKARKREREGELYELVKRESGYQ